MRSIIYRGSLNKWDKINNSIEKMVKDWENISQKMIKMNEEYLWKYNLKQ